MDKTFLRFTWSGLLTLAPAYLWWWGAGLLFGVALGTLGTINSIPSLCYLTSLVLLAVSLIERKTNFIFLALFIFGLGLGGGRTELVMQQQNLLSRYLNQKIELTGQVVAFPEETDRLVRLALKVDNLPVKILVTTERYPVYHLGDRLQVQGVLKLPATATSSAGFDYRQYLAKDGVFYLVSYPKIVGLSDQVNFFFQSLTFLRQKLLAAINRVLPPPDSSLLAGILLGEKQGLSASLKDDFNKAGLSHILVLSGFNVTIVATWLLLLCSWLPPIIGAWLGAVGMIIFGLVAGGGTVVWRAVMMALIAWYARASGQVFNATLALWVTILVLTWWQPLILVSDLGFQLSVLAVLGLLFLAPIFSQWGRRLSLMLPSWLDDLLASSVAAQIMVLPLICWSLGRLSLVGFVSNLVVLPLIPPVMVLGSALVACALGCPWLASLVAPTVYLFLRLVRLLVLWFATWPLSNLTYAWPGWLIVGIYLILFLVIVYQRYHNQKI